jgi:hypothetical protein
MLTSAQAQQQATAVDQVRAFMKRNGLKLDDLINYGGEDLNDPRRAEMARRVERSWGLVAACDLTFAVLEASA